MLTKLKERTVLALLYILTLLASAPEHARANDEKVWAALKQGGKIILLRHTYVDIREGIGHLAPGNCAEEINLSPRGIEQAKRIGETFRAHGIAVGDVLTSPYCRCIDTGVLAFGRATPVQFLRPPGTVSENQAKLNQERVVQEILKHLVLEDTVPMGEFFVLQPKGTDFDVLGKIQVDDR